MLKLTVKPGEYLLIGNEIKLVFAGGSSNNLRILVDAPRSMNIARSSIIRERKDGERAGNVVTHYKDRELSKEAQEKIRAILAEERKKARMAKRVQEQAKI